jgi:transcriptional regulator with XRE-family HTH domain
MDPIEIVEGLVTRSRQVGLTMGEVCRAAGIAESTPSRWRSGKFMPKLRTLSLLMAVIEDRERLNASVIDGASGHTTVEMTLPGAPARVA